MEFDLLGGLSVRDGGTEVDLGGLKQRAVLAALLLEPGRSITADRLIDLVWGDDSPARAASSLQAYVSNLRRALEPHRRPREEPTVLVTRASGYAVDVPREAVDVTRFEDLAALGHTQVGPGTVAAAKQAAPTLDEALATWSGSLLPELAHEPWVTEAARRLERLRAQAVEDRVEAGLVLGEHAAMVPRLEAAIAADPYREGLRAQLALALYRSGRQREALAAIEAARTELGEVGLEPGRALRRLEQDILEQRPELDAPSVPAPAADPDQGSGATVSDVGAGRSTEAGERRERTGGSPFVGRDHELATVLEALTGSLSGAGRPVVISGEPGIGKTRLVEELTARAGGAAVAWARCPESAAQAAYWSCIQIGRQLEAQGVVSPGLIAALLPEETVTSDADPMADRLALHLQVARVLESAEAPLVVVIDDLQWADPASLRVVEFLAGELKRLGILLVVTVRPLGPDAADPLVDCLAELARAPGAVRLDLSGLPVSAISEWMAVHAGRSEPAVATLVHDRTGGNAFFVGEVVALLGSEGRLTDAEATARGTTVPAAVHDVVRRRVGRLAPDTQQLLTAASVVGRTFDLDVLGAVTGLGPGEVLDHLEPALDAGLVIEDERPGRFLFAHALVADALVAELSAIRRARLHAATAEALLQLRGTALDEDVAALAHHTYEGAAAGIAEDAYTWSVEAARLASVRLAHEDAARHWLRAARAVEMARPLDVQARHHALLESGRAAMRVDAVVAAFEPLVAAIELGLAAGDPDMIVQPAAAMNVEGLWVAGEISLTSVDAVGALQRAVRALPPEPTVGRALALGAYAENAYWHLPPEEIDAISAEAVEVARAAGDRDVLARSLHKRNQSMWRADSFAQRTAAIEELVALVDEQPPEDPDLEAVAMFGAASVSWEDGDLDTTWTRLRRATALAERTGTPALVTQLAFFEASVLLTRGEIDRAQSLIDDSYDLYRRTRRWAADAFRAGFKGVGWMESERVDVIEEEMPALIDSPYGLVFGECIALMFAEVGDLDRAAALTPTELPLLDGWPWLGVAASAAHNRVNLGDHEAARTMGEVLRPYAGRLAPVGTGPAFGDVHLALGRVARLLGDDEGALAHYDASVDLLTRADAVPWLARALLHRHELTGDAADLDRAAAAVATRDVPLVARRVRERRAAAT